MIVGVPYSWWGKFCLTNLIRIFKDKYFPQTVPVTALEHTYASYDLEYAIGNYVDFINEYGGFSVVMWYSRGEITYKSLIGTETTNDPLLLISIHSIMCSTDYLFWEYFYLLELFG